MDQDNDFDKALNRAINFISYRPRSIREVTDKLSLLDYSYSVIESVVQQLTEIGLLNDDQFALLWAESRINSKQIGRYKLRQELIHKGISSDVTDSLLSRLYEEYGELELATEKLQNKYGRRSNPYDPEKMIRFLGRNGYSYQIAKKAVDTFLNKIDEEKNELY